MNASEAFATLRGLGVPVIATADAVAKIPSERSRTVTLRALNRLIGG